MENLTDYQVHEAVMIDECTAIIEGTGIWHFSHTMSQAPIGRKCHLSQNVGKSTCEVLSRIVKIHNKPRTHEDVTCGEGVFLKPSMAYAHIINPRIAAFVPSIKSRLIAIALQFPKP